MVIPAAEQPRRGRSPRSHPPRIGIAVLVLFVGDPSPRLECPDPTGEFSLGTSQDPIPSPATP